MNELMFTLFFNNNGLSHFEQLYSFNYICPEIRTRLFYCMVMSLKSSDCAANSVDPD